MGETLDRARLEKTSANVAEKETEVGGTGVKEDWLIKEENFLRFLQICSKVSIFLQIFSKIVQSFCKYSLSFI